MLVRNSISKAAPTDPGLDQQQLYAMGLAYVRDLSRRIWTDHNVHDPGITTLELLCYALTDLTYRTSLPIEDLLATDGDNAKNMRDQFFTARQILPNRALTVADYRKLIIDLPGVKNAWVRPFDLTYFADTIHATLARAKPDGPGVRSVAIRGLYGVQVEYMEQVLTDQDKARVNASVMERLQANRNLCEDFVAVTGVEQQPFQVCGELELTPDADTSRVTAEVLTRVEHYLAPPVGNYSLGEMLDRRTPDGTSYTVADIFDGPALDCGFIDTAELSRAELRTEVRLSDVMGLIMDIDGVVAVKDLVINPRGLELPLDSRWLVSVEAGKQPTLDESQSRLVFRKRNMPVVASPARVAEYRAAFAEQARQKLETPTLDDIPIPSGRFRSLQRYYSFQNHYPAIYGLSDYGVPNNDDTRRALARQLKAYLLFFDQVMANYCAQIARVRELFSCNPDLAHTYFSQVVDSFAEFEQIYGPGDTQQKLDELTEHSAVKVERQNRFLDHLIARFAERFHDYAAVMSSAFGASPSALVRDKCAFLAGYPAIGAERGLAYNYALQTTADVWNSGNVSGLERRIARLLGIGDASRRDLSTIALDAHAEVDGTTPNGFVFRIRHRSSEEILLRSSTTYPSADLARQQLTRTLELAGLPSGYERTAPGNTLSFEIIAEGGEVLAMSADPFETVAARDQAVDNLIAYVREWYSREGLFLIENLLLRPAGDDPFLPICVDPNCTDCVDDDPYSYRIHVILPAGAARFGDMDFRRFAEEVIREETPAHILPKICWVDEADIAALEKVYRIWLELPADATAGQRHDALRALITTLYEVKNVYPQQQLRECDSPEDQPKFILGRTALGTRDGGDA